MTRKRTLVDHGFRLPQRDGQPAAAVGGVPRADRPDRLPVGDARAVRAGARRRRRRADHPADRPGRPGGRRQADQGPDRRPASTRSASGPSANERVLVTTLTKKMSEDLTDYLLELGHPGALPALARSTRCAGSSCCASCGWASSTCSSASTCCARASTCPRCRWCAILDADKEGFLRSSTSLIQTIGRAARNVSGQVHMYADTITPSMAQAIDETNRRRAKQVAYNPRRGVDPQPLRKKIADITDLIAREDADTEALHRLGSARSRAARRWCPGSARGGDAGRHAAELAEHAARRAGRPDPAAHRPDARGGGRAAVRAGRPAARRDLRAEEGAARDGRRRSAADVGRAVGDWQRRGVFPNGDVVITVGLHGRPGRRRSVSRAEETSGQRRSADVPAVPVPSGGPVVGREPDRLGRHRRRRAARHRRRPRSPSAGVRTCRRMRESTLWVLLFIGLALAFGGARLGASGASTYAGQFYAGWLTEYSLSVDNLFVFVIIMSRFGVPACGAADRAADRHPARAALPQHLHRPRRRGDQPVLLGLLLLRRLPRLHRLEAAPGTARTTTSDFKENARPAAASAGSCRHSDDYDGVTAAHDGRRRHGSSPRCSS